MKQRFESGRACLGQRDDVGVKIGELDGLIFGVAGPYRNQVEAGSSFTALFGFYLQALIKSIRRLHV